MFAWLEKIPVEVLYGALIVTTLMQPVVLWYVLHEDRVAGEQAQPVMVHLVQQSAPVATTALAKPSARKALGDTGSGAAHLTVLPSGRLQVTVDKANGPACRGFREKSLSGLPAGVTATINGGPLNLGKCVSGNDNVLTVEGPG